MSSRPEETTAALVASFRDEWGRVLATLLRLTGDWDLAEDATAEAFSRAAATWPRDGVPARPGAWLTTAARNYAITRATRARKEIALLQEAAVFAAPTDADPSGIDDDRLRLIFTCCHPALPLEARVALTLRTLCGLTTQEIARALLVSETAMAARITRAKKRIQHTGIPFRAPEPERLAERLPGVLAVLYLVFNAGYAAPEGEPIRADLVDEAIRLTQLVASLLPDEREVTGLLALMQLHAARRAARLDADGELIGLEEQDRTRWDHAAIAGAVRLVDRAWAGGSPGPYAVQAAIAACHATALSVEATDWVAVAAFYRMLSGMTANPVVALNRAAALGMADGPAVGLASLAELDDEPALAGYYLLPATRADLLRRLGDRDGAAAAYRVALDLAPDGSPARFLRRRLAEVTQS